MSLKKRAIEGIVVAGSLVMMSTIAQAADLDGVQVRNAAVQAETDFATGGTAGVVARLDQLEAEAFGDIEAATAGVTSGCYSGGSGFGYRSCGDIRCTAAAGRSNRDTAGRCSTERDRGSTEPGRWRAGSRCRADRR